MSALVIILIAVVILLAYRLGRLHWQIDALERRLDKIERHEEAPSAATAPTAAPVQPNDAPLRRDLLPPVLDEQKLPPTTTPAVTKPPPRPTPAPVEKAPIDWEQFMGVKLFAWLGGFALFLGVAFWVKYSFENNLITPLGRVVIGGLIAGALLAIGAWLARGRYRVTAQSLCATGIVILYADLFAAHSFYGLISLTTAFFAMAAVTLFSFLLAVGLKAQVIVILGLLGGFLTPALLPSGTDNAPALFLYIGLLDLGVAAVALRQRWLYLVPLAAIGTAAIQLGWASQYFNSARGREAFWIFLGFEALFLAIFFCGRFALRSADHALPGEEAIRTSGDFTRVSQSETSTALVIAAAVAGFSALGFGFWLLAIPLLARQPLFFLSFIFLADAGVLALPVFGRASRLIALGAGALTFALVAAWIGLFSPQAPLIAALAAIVIFALLHAATTPASAWRPGTLPLTAAGTVTPYLLLIILAERMGLWNPTPVFLVAFLLSAILLIAAIVRQADWLSAAALLGLALLEIVWHLDRFGTDEAIPILVWDGLFLVLFIVYPFCSPQKERPWAWAISALAQVLQFGLIHRVVSLAWPNDWMGLLPAAFSLPAAAGVVALLSLYRAVPASGDARLAWQGGALLLFVSLIFPLQFEREWITLGWALEGAALLWLFQRLPHRGLRFVGIGLLSAAFVRLALNPAVLEYHRRTGRRIWNWYLYAYGVASGCLLAGAHLLGRPGARRGGLERMLLGSLGAVLVFLLLNLEIADYFSIGPTLTFSFSGNFARDMTYSIAWALFALALILAGMQLQERLVRYAGVALLGVTLGKLFLHDLSDLDELYRIGAFVSVALILIAASFLYQRFLSPKRA